MGAHVKILALLYIAIGALGACAALLLLLVLGGAAGIVEAGAGLDADAWIVVPILTFIAVAVFFCMLLISVPNVIAGIGLLQGHRWGRVLAIVLSAFNLFNVPFGTFLGIYGLWVLLSREADVAFAHGGTKPA